MLQPVTNEEIQYAESILLPEGSHFDAERVSYIKCLTTCDLQAVPGSGKTTALLAKLLILDKRLPLASGEGILVISHTNTAVDEIKRKLAPYCTKIFSYPNYIGTIQGFVDAFLAIPYYITRFGHKPVRIDNEIYEQKVKRYTFNVGTRNWLNSRQDPDQFLINIRFNVDEQLISTLRASPAFPVGIHTPTYQALRTMKMRLLEKGYLHFDDAYYLASKYIRDYPKVLNLLRERFHCIFVDEMQDMENHQFALLEEIFHFAGGDNIFQRIGDRNQSIFSGNESDESSWAQRDPVLTLSGSHRLSSLVARAVQPFGLYADTEIVGRYNSPLRPHLLVFTNATKANVLPRFGALVSQYIEDGRIAPNYKYPIKAIGWVAKPSEGAESLFIPDYFAQYDKTNKAIKIDHHNLISYLTFFDRKAKTLKGVRNNILNAILWVLREEEIDFNGRDYTKKQFLAQLKQQNKSQYEKLNLNLFQWSMEVIKNHIGEVRAAIQEYVTQMVLTIKEVPALKQQTTEFLTSEEIGEQDGEQEAPTNVYKHGDLDIEVATIHSVKGQTHTATLYMETKFYTHESQKCIQQLLGHSALNIHGTRKREAAKMMYVGFSRPTDLLCFAASRDRIEEHLPALDQHGWEIIEVN